MWQGIREHWDVLRDSLRLERENSATRRNAAETEFLPAALEILETPASPAGRTVLWALISFVAIALIWACIGRIDMVASASGKVIPRGSVKTIQPSDYGVVRAIHVVEGQSVAAGSPLVELDSTVSKAEVEQARQALVTAELDVSRTRALVDYAAGRGNTFHAPAGALAPIVDIQTALVRAKIREYETARAGLRQELAQRHGDAGMVAAEVDKLEQQLPLVTDQHDKLESLSKNNYVPRLQVSEVKERLVGMRQDLAIRREEVFKSRAGERAVLEQLAKTESEFAREALDALTEAEAARALRAEELKKANEKAGRTVLSAPVAGIVQQLQIHTIGGVVKPADPLMIVVPIEGELIVEAMVPNKDAGFIRAGQAVEVKLEAYPFTRYGVIDGVVEYIGRDAVQTEKEGLLYPARVRLRQAWIDIGGKRTALAPGLAATAEIKTGDRRIIEYLLSPLAKRAQEAGRER